MSPENPNLRPIDSNDVVILADDEIGQFFIELGIDPELKEIGILRFSSDRFKVNLLNWIKFRIAEQDEVGVTKRTAVGRRISGNGLNVLESVVKYGTRGGLNRPVAGRMTVQRIDGSDKLEYFTQTENPLQMPEDLGVLAEEDLEFVNRMLERVYEVLIPAEK